MNRRTFLATSAGAASGALFPTAVHARRPQADLILRGGTVYDGSGAAPVETDVVIAGGRFLALERGASRAGATELDVRGLAVAPGFIDIHSHTDTGLLRDPPAESKLRQGVTTEVAGQDGGSVAPGDDAATLGDFFRTLERNGIPVNFASMVGAGTLRGHVVGNADRLPTAAQLERMVALVRQALADGACGLSSGLEYTPGGFAQLDELIALARPLRGTGLPYASHMRNEDDQLLAAVEEALNVGRLAGVAVHISHLKSQGGRNWWKAEPVLRVLEAAKADGTDVTYDRYPYIAYSTGLSNLFPLWTRDGGTDAFIARLRDAAQRPRIEAAVRDKIDELGSWDAVQITSTGSAALGWARGKRLGALARERGEEPFALLLRLIIEDRARAGMVGFGMSEENTERFLSHPLGMVCSDAPARVASATGEGTSHPRGFGSYPRVLGHYVRERRIMPLETAIMKMTSMPAARLKFADRGRIAPGLAADVVVFDPDTVADRATFELPHRYPVGIPHVIVNGEIVLRAGEHTGARPGRIVKPGA